MDDDKQRKLQNVKRKLKSILSFLKDYLPLANCHSTDFITRGHWDNFLSENIKENLLSLSDKDLIKLHSEQWTEDEKTEDLPRHERNIGDTCTTQDETCGNWTYSCPYMDSAPKYGDQRNIYTEECREYKPNWVHNDVKSFLTEARKNTLRSSNVLSTYENLQCKLEVKLQGNRIFIKDFMNTKKCHEVEVMGNVCAVLSDYSNVDVIIDMGSGKGYLSTQLAFQHDLTVIGIDAQTVNTKGASKRAGVLAKQWNGLMRNAVFREGGKQTKIGKKLKRQLKKEKQSLEMAKADNRETEIGIKTGDMTNSEGQSQKSAASDEISEDVLGDMGTLFLTKDEDLSSDSVISNLKEIPAGDETIKVINDVTEIDVASFGDVSNRKDDSLDCISTLSELKHLEGHETMSMEGQTGYKSENKHLRDFGLDMLDVKQNAEIEVQSENLNKSAKTELTKDVHFSPKSRTCKKSQKHFPLTIYVDSDVDLKDIVRQTVGDINLKSQPQRSTSGETNLMLTGLHTCGGLGSSILELFVKCPEAPVLCNVSCCYHLMEEQFVASPFENDEKYAGFGFPLSSFLKEHKVGLGRLARNFASQALSRDRTGRESKPKQFPRILLQAILQDVLGYTKKDWKGLRKLHEKSADMFDYVHRAFQKLNLSTDLINRELVDHYCQKYKDQERNFLAFFQLRSALAPCIEAVVLLDRMCYLLEQDCVSDAMLVELFDPVTSPRCYGIIAFKQGV